MQLNENREQLIMLALRHYQQHLTHTEKTRPKTKRRVQHLINLLRIRELRRSLQTD